VNKLPPQGSIISFAGLPAKDNVWVKNDEERRYAIFERGYSKTTLTHDMLKHRLTMMEGQHESRLHRQENPPIVRVWIDEATEMDMDAFARFDKVTPNRLHWTRADADAAILRTLASKREIQEQIVRDAVTRNLGIKNGEGQKLPLRTPVRKERGPKG
jgi:hypothetical protein